MARWVKKSDGRIEPYDEARIVRAVLRAGRRAGNTAEIEQLAREIARSVTFFLGKRSERVAETALVAQAMEQALEQTGHEAIAHAARDWREWRRRRRSEVRIRERPAVSATAVEVLTRNAARPWTKQRIVQALTQEAELDREAAEDVARAVEERVFAAGLNQISTTLLRELIDAELFERGFSAQLGRLEVLGVPRPDLEQLVVVGAGRVPLALEDRVSRTVLERYALDDLVAGRGATAHLRGDVHLVGLGRPFRVASGAASAAAVASGQDPRGLEPGGGAPPPTPLGLARALVRVARQAAPIHELMFGLVGVPAALASAARVSGGGAADAVEVLLDALSAPCPDDVPPAPEVVLAVDAPEPGTPEHDVVLHLVAAMSRRGPRGAGVRLLLRLSAGSPGGTAGVLPLLAALASGAAAGACFDLALGEGEGPSSRGAAPGATAIQVGLLNLAGLSLAAGRGERARFAALVEQAVEALLDAFHHRQRMALALLARPAYPLFGAGEVPALAGDVDTATSAVGLVGLEAALRYLTGEGPAENPRVCELGAEVLLDLRAALEVGASRLGLGRVVLEEAPAGDAGLRLAGLDLNRFPDARDLLGDAPGWDTGLAQRSEAVDPLGDLAPRLWLARRVHVPLVLARPALAASPSPGALAEGVVAALARRPSGRREP